MESVEQAWQHYLERALPHLLGVELPDPVIRGAFIAGAASVFYMMGNLADSGIGQNEFASKMQQLQLELTDQLTALSLSP